MDIHPPHNLASKAVRNKAGEPATEGKQLPSGG